jgi:Tol biopolymer transport system component
MLLPAPEILAWQATPTDASGTVRVVEEQTVDLPEYRFLSMSPDGRWLLALDDELDRLCSIEIATLKSEKCVDVRAAGFLGPVEHSVTWSPDGSQVAMTEDGLIKFHEPDIWVFEAATGRLTNLTDDGVEGGTLLSDPGTPRVDLFPAWSPDGLSIAFARAVRGDDGWADAEGGIFRVGIDGGQPEQIAPLPAPAAYAVYPELRWSADGSFLAYSLAMPDRDHAANGVWTVNADGTNQRQVLDDDDLERPLLVDLSARGVALVVSAEYLINLEAYDGTRMVAVDLATGAVTSLDALPPPMWGAPMLPLLTFSPDGSRLLYINVALPTRERRLLVYDFDAEETQTVLDPIDSWLGGAVPTGLVWGDDDLVFVPGFRATAILLRLDGDRKPKSANDRARVPSTVPVVR